MPRFKKIVFLFYLYFTIFGNTGILNAQSYMIMPTIRVYSDSLFNINYVDFRPFFSVRTGMFSGTILWLHKEQDSVLKTDTLKVSATLTYGNYSAVLPCAGTCNRARYYAYKLLATARGPAGKLQFTRMYEPLDESLHTWFELNGRPVWDCYSCNNFNLLRIQTDSGYWVGEWRSEAKPHSLPPQKKSNVVSYGMPFPFRQSPYMPSSEMHPSGTWYFVTTKGSYEHRVFQIESATNAAGKTEYFLVAK